MAPRRKFADTTGRNNAAVGKERRRKLEQDKQDEIDAKKKDEPTRLVDASLGDGGNWLLDQLGINLAVRGIKAAGRGIYSSYNSGSNADAAAYDSATGEQIPLTPQMQQMLQLRATTGVNADQNRGPSMGGINYGSYSDNNPAGVDAGLSPSGLATAPQPKPTWSEDANSRPGAESDYATTLAGRKARKDAALARSDAAVAATKDGLLDKQTDNADTVLRQSRTISDDEKATQKAIGVFLGDRESLAEVDAQLAEITETTSTQRVLEGLKLAGDNSKQYMAAHENRLSLKASLEREQARLQGVVISGAQQADGLLGKLGLLGEGLDTVMQLSDSEVDQAIEYAIGIDEGRIPDPRPITEFEGPAGAVVNAGNSVLAREGVNGVAGSMFEKNPDGTWDAVYSQFNGSQDYIDWFVTKFDAVAFQMPTALEDGTNEMQWVTFDQVFNDISSTDDEAIQDNMTNMLAGAMLFEMEEDIVNQSAEIWESGAGKWNDILSSIYQSLAAAQNGGGADGATLDARAAQREELQGNFNDVVESL